MAKHNHLGLWGEQVAARYLAERGYVIMERDWRFGLSLIHISPLITSVCI